MMQRSEMADHKTLFDLIWDAHCIKHLDDGRDLIFVDRHVLQETTSAQAFNGLRKAQRAVRFPALTIATQDHLCQRGPVAPRTAIRRVVN